MTCFGWECFGEQAEIGAIAVVAAAAIQARPVRPIVVDNQSNLAVDGIRAGTKLPPHSKSVKRTFKFAFALFAFGEASVFSFPDSFTFQEPPC